MVAGKEIVVPIVCNGGRREGGTECLEGFKQGWLMVLSGELSRAVQRWQ
jgi:hypothetical protein